ncbi:NUDIX domain-containing protein [Legionella dresdenensis]|uniref:NUDIX domain-containing protein n=1 Tax=Legionella dresdenensis TaxID=450200 RepID=A0ABV8CGF7_9GAMM
MKLYHLMRGSLSSLFARRTIGVRILLINDNKVLLVKHTYTPGWYTIGGGVDRGETPAQAIQRELQEETGVTLIGPLQLFSVYYSKNEKRDDYVVFYVAHGCRQEEVYSPEIAEQQWFAFDNLPTDTTPSTRRRIAEYLNKVEISEYW